LPEREREGEREGKGERGVGGAEERETERAYVRVNDGLPERSLAYICK